MASFITRARIITFIGVLMALFHLYTAGFRLYPAMQQRTTHLVFALVLVFLVFPFRKKQAKTFFSVLDIFLVFLAIFIGILCNGRL